MQTRPTGPAAHLPSVVEAGVRLVSSSGLWAWSGARSVRCDEVTIRHKGCSVVEGERGLWSPFRTFLRQALCVEQGQAFQAGKVEQSALPATPCSWAGLEVAVGRTPQAHIGTDPRPRVLGGPQRSQGFRLVWSPDGTVEGSVSSGLVGPGGSVGLLQARCVVLLPWPVSGSRGT